MKRPPIRILDLSGSPEAMGTAHGLAYRDEIRHFTAERVALVAGGAWSGGPIPEGEVLEIAGSMLTAHQEFNPDIHAEMLAMAAAADITPAQAVVVGGFTDFIDTVRAVTGGPTPDTVIEDDCTAVIVPDNRAEGHGYYAQTWDMHDTATDHVLMLRIRPDDGPETLLFTTTGCVGQIGMNEVGLCVGINNLTGADGTRGVTWPAVVRAMLTVESAPAALDILLAADLAGAHNYLIFDRSGRGYSVEAMPSVRPVTELADQPLIHTNHVLNPVAQKVEVERATELQQSSEARLARADELLAEGPIDTERLMALTRDRQAICQVPFEPFRVESSGAAIMRPATGDFWACWGPPTDNDYYSVPFDSSIEPEVA